MFFKLFFTYVVLGIVQVFVLNRISLLGCATPFLYIYFILPFRRNYPKWIIILCGFIMGLSMDIFTNTPGVAAASSTLLAFIQPFILNLFVQKDSADDMMPTIKVLGLRRYISYSLICVFIYCLIFYSIETFNFFNWQQWLLDIAGSTILTALLIIVIENVRKR
ncbi:MAG: rod shape-determining protein MreD [Prevotella sp.]|nr:rod shape-determining protein MreD [Prevotella sp.]